VALLVLVLVPASARAQENPDVFNSATLNPVVAGNEAPFTTPQQLARAYDSTAYTLEPGEKPRMGCATGSGFDFAGRTAWHRFVVGAKGSVRFGASSGYDLVLFAFRTTLPRGAKGFSEDVLTTVDCSDASHGNGELPLAAIRVEPGQTILMASGSYCGTSANTCNENATGGPTTLNVTYTPDDGDGDGTADTLDACPSTPAPGGCPSTANPDADADGVLNERDKCPTIKGTEDDGCLDSDRDAISDFADRCPQVPGNGRDGCPQPLNATFPNQWINFARFSRVQKLQVKAPKGAAVQFRCRGKGCRTKRATFHQKHAAESLKRYLKRNLPKGTRIEVRVTAPLTLGTFVRFEVRGRRANPRRTDRCITASGGLTRC